jgi:hypothetical protein
MVQRDEIRAAMEHFRARAAAQARAETALGSLERGAFKLPGTRVEREVNARKFIEALRALRDAGKLTLPQFVQAAGFYALNIVHDYRVMDGDYVAELEPLSARITEIERAHGLKEDEFWLNDEGPEDWQNLNREFDAALVLQQISVLREFGLCDLALMLESDSRRFNELWVRGTSAVDEILPPRERLEQLIAVYRSESVAAESVGALHGAAALRGPCVPTSRETLRTRKLLSRAETRNRAWENQR